MSYVSIDPKVITKCNPIESDRFSTKLIVLLSEDTLPKIRQAICLMWKVFGSIHSVIITVSETMNERRQFMNGHTFTSSSIQRDLRVERGQTAS